MLRIFPVVLEVLKELQPVLRRIEGQARYHSALGSARETLSCLEVAVVFGYVAEDARLHDRLDRVVGTLVKLVRS